MNLIRSYFSKYYWKCRFSWRSLFGSVLAALGIFVTLVEITTSLYPTFVENVKSSFSVFIILGVLWSFWETRAKLSFAHRLDNRDISIQVCVADMFKVSGEYIISSNTTFETTLDKNFISKKSIQGQFTTKFYDNIGHLDGDLEEALKDRQFEIDSSRTKGKNKKYPIGTVAKITPKNKTAYFVALAEINSHGNTKATYEGLKNVLATLWDFLIDHGNMEPIVLPVLGSGFSRINQKREDIIYEIIDSFVAACSARKFCERLILVIHPKDLTSCDINLDDLDKYIGHVCKYTAHKTETTGVGIGII